MPGLHHLDDMPVTDKERRLATAFLHGGLEVSLRCLSASGWHTLLTGCTSAKLHGYSAVLLK